MGSKSQHLHNQNNVILLKANKGKTILEAERDQVHTANYEELLTQALQ
jgi:hypothetical protein